MAPFPNLGKKRWITNLKGFTKFEKKKEIKIKNIEEKEKIGGRLTEETSEKYETENKDKNSGEKLH